MSNGNKSGSKLIIPNIVKTNDIIADNTEALFYALIKKILKKEWNNNILSVFLVTMNDPYNANSDIRYVKIGINKQLGNKYSHSLLLDYFRQYLLDASYFETNNKDFCYTISITKENLSRLKQIFDLLNGSKKRK